MMEALVLEDTEHCETPTKKGTLTRQPERLEIITRGYYITSLLIYLYP